MTTREPHHSPRRRRPLDPWLLLAALLAVLLIGGAIVLELAGDSGGAQLLVGLSSEVIGIAGFRLAQNRRNGRR